MLSCPSRGEGELDQTKYEHQLPSPLVGEGPGVRVAGEGAGFRRCDECSDCVPPRSLRSRASPASPAAKSCSARRRPEISLVSCRAIARLAKRCGGGSERKRGGGAQLPTTPRLNPGSAIRLPNRAPGF